MNNAIDEVQEMKSRPGPVRSEKETPKNYLKKLALAHPLADPIKLHQMMWENYDEAWTKLFFDHWFQYHIKLFRNENTKGKHTSKTERESQLQQIRTMDERRIEERAKIKLSEMLMPNGKKLQDCTGSDCTKLGNTVGPWLLKLGRRLRPRQHVGTVFSETELTEIYHTSGSVNAKRKSGK